MGIVKVFSGSEIMATGLKLRIEEAGIRTIIKNNIDAGRITGFGTTGLSMDVFVNEEDFEEIKAILKEFES